MEIIQVPPTKTPLGKGPAIYVLKTAWTEVMGSAPTPKQLAIIMAHWALETGWGDKMIQYNFGNIKGATQQGPSQGMVTRFTTHEGFGKSREKIKGGFRAYKDVMEGAKDYLLFLKEKYSSSMDCAQKEDVEGFVRNLSGYFTDSPTKYLDVVNYAYRVIQQELGILPPKPTSPVATSKPKSSRPKSKQTSKKSTKKKSHMNLDQLTKLASQFCSAAQDLSLVKVAKGKYDHIDFKPPESVAKAAARGLELRKKNKGRGGLNVQQAAKQGIGSGVARAVSLKNRQTLSPSTVRRMKSFFARHAGNEKVDPGKTLASDRGYIAFMIWGGRPGRSWANKICRQMDAADKKK